MASKRLRCRFCGVPSLVPPGAPSLHCAACGSVTILQSDYNGYRPSGFGGNPNLMPINPYMTGPGYAAQGRPYRPVNMGYVPPVQAQPYPPPAFGRKRAVLCGISYKGHTQSLNGSINDVLSMKKLLVERFGFPSSAILLLTEEGDVDQIPTKRNIRAALFWLMQGCQPGDSLVFYYSGHGSQVRDRDGDELDGYDESLLPVDYQEEGRILDDELNRTLVRPLPRGATLHSIIDTCFSGTFLDLPNVCKINREGFYKWEDHRTQHAGYKGTSGGQAISISACEDHQNALTGDTMGALTYSFVQTLRQEPRLTYGTLLMSMYKRIRATRQEAGLNSNAPHLSQDPILSSSSKFDIYSKIFTL